jgi:putative hydrolase of the HAD superfamily
MPFTALFIDLDDTIYPNTNGLWGAIRERMGLYMHERLGLAPEEALAIRRRYVENYGTTLRGLQIHYQVDPHEFLAYVHDLPLEVYLQPDPALPETLASLSQPKWILTNADAGHASRVLAYFGISHLFSGVIDIHALGYICKPETEAYRRAMAIAGQADPTSCVFLDDSVRNLAPAHQLGLTTVLVGSKEPDPAADYSIASLKELRTAFPQLWDSSPAGERTS